MRRCIHCEQPIILTTYMGWMHRLGKKEFKYCKDAMRRKGLAFSESSMDNATPAPDR